MDPSVIRTLRLRLKMTQEQFARELGVSTPLVRNSEKGSRLSEATIERVKSLAAKHHLADLLVNSGAVSLPGPTRILDAGKPRVIRKRNPQAADLADHLHDAIDKLIESGNSELVATVEAVVNLALASAKKGMQ